MVVVTHELASIFAIADRALYLDVATRTTGGLGDPKSMRYGQTNENLRLFLNRGHDADSMPPLRTPPPARRYCRTP